ncbi:DnaD domain-containing protein [Geobacillus jurassicus]|uniref:DnaD domain-containing protein n=1 Tax=Geobacillus jurassicus TaxID=235932 RepID=A0ABV6GX98_9BACL|nr:DnaD domain protein [Geobacillus jurassicus]
MAALLLDDQPLIVLPKLAMAIGLNESIVVQQLHYWLEKSEHVHDGYKWVYNTYGDWQEQFPFWSESTIRRIITKLEKMGIIVAANFNRSKIDKTKWYRIDYDKLAEWTQETLGGQDEQTIVQDDVSMLQDGALMVQDGVSTVQHEQTTGGIADPSVQNEQSSCSNWPVEPLNLTTSIPENTSEMTSEMKKEDEEDARVRTYKEIVRFYEENGFGVIGDYLREKINVWVDETSEELVLEALKIAVENGAKRWVYVETILRDWTEKGYRTVDQVRAARLAFREQRLKQRSSLSSSDGGRTMRKPIRTEIVPDWLKMDYSQPEDDDFDIEQARRELEERLKKYKDHPDGASP